MTYPSELLSDTCRAKIQPLEGSLYRWEISSLYKLTKLSEKWVRLFRLKRPAHFWEKCKLQWNLYFMVWSVSIHETRERMITRELHWDHLMSLLRIEWSISRYLRDQFRFFMIPWWPIMKLISTRHLNLRIWSYLLNLAYTALIEFLCYILPLYIDEISLSVSEISNIWKCCMLVLDQDFSI